MAWSSAALTAVELANLAADKPLVATNAIPQSPTLAKWTETGTGAATSRTLSTAPARRAYDGFPCYATTPDTTSASTWYFYVETAAAGVEFDCAFIMGHNFGTLSLTTVQIQIADDAAFTSNVETVADFGTPSTDDRLQDLALLHTGATALRYSAVRYVRLKLSKAGNFTPSMCELVLGRRRQLDRKPDRPFDSQAYANESELARSMGGVSQTVVYHRNRLEIDAEWPVESSAYVTDWRAFWAACRGPFVWVYAPSSAPASFNLMVRDQDAIDFPETVATNRTARLVAHEQGPESYFLANE